MRRLMRILLATVGVLGLIAVGAVVYVTTFFDPNDLKPRLIDAVRERSGLELALDGPLNWSFYPRLGVSMEDARAWLPGQPIEDDAFAAIERAEVSLSFAPLLSGDIAIDGLTLEGMGLDLVRDEQGRGNWEVLLERLEQEEGAAKAALAPASAGPTMRHDADVALDIANVQIKDSRVHYADRRSGLDITVSDIEVSGTNVNPVNTFPLKVHFLVDSAAPGLSSEINLQSKVRLGLDDSRYVLEDLTLDTQIRLAEFEDQSQALSLKVERLVAEVSNARYLLDKAALTGNLQHPSLGESALPINFSFNGEADLQKQTAQLSDLLLTSEKGLKVSGALSFTELLEAPSYSGQINLAPLSLRPWLERFNALPETADNDALNEVAFTSPIQGDLESVALANLALVVDDTTLTGRLEAGLDGRSLAFNLQGDRVDIDAYLPPEEAPATEVNADASLAEPLGSAPAYAASEMAGLVPVALLEELSIEGEARLDELKVKGMTLLEPNLMIRGNEGHHHLERLDAQLYDGTLSASADLDVREQPIHWAFNHQLKGVQIVPLVEDLTGEPSPLRGRLNMSGDFTSRGNDAANLLQNLNGQTEFHVADGAVFDINVSRELCTAVATLEGETSTREWSSDTRFDRLEGSIEVVDGVASNDDLSIAIPGIELTGGGELSMPTQRLDYRAQARFVDTADAACDVNPRLERLPLPIRCKGAIGDEPREWCGFDRQAFRQALAELARDEVESEAAERISEELEERLGGDTERKINEKLGEGAAKELRDAVRGLFN